MMKQKFSPTPPRRAVEGCESDAECEMVSCDECMKRIPAEQAVKSESQDYVRHFCGLECFRRWQQRRQSA